MNKINIYRNFFIKIAKFFLLILFLFLPSFVRAMPPGALVYRTSGEGKMYGYSGDPLVYTEKGIVKNVYSGHVGIYIGQENGVDYIVEALADGIVKTPAANFVNLAEGEKYLGAKIPRNLNAIQQAKVVAIAKSLVGKNLAYDFDFKTQKGPESGEWTCVGLTEKIYESADISNPNNLDALEYDQNYYALDITPDGYDNYSIINSLGDCFSKDYEFSKIARRSDLLIPAPELIGFDLGLENNGERYIFLPYTQFLQKSLTDVETDITIASSFSGASVRGRVPTAALVLRWSLINNPLSSIKAIAQKTKEVILSVSDKIFGTGNNQKNTEIVLVDDIVPASSSEAIAIRQGVTVNKATTSRTVISKVATNKIKTDKNITPTRVVNITKATSSVAKKVASKKGTTTKAVEKAEGQATSTAKIAAYYNPIIKPKTTPSSSSGGGGGSSSSAAALDNFPKIATINKIYSTGNNDWIELYNTGDRDFDLASAGYRLEKAKTAEDPSLIMRIGNSEDGAYPTGTVIKAHSSYLIVKSTASNYYLSRADAIATREDFNWSGSGYTIYLGTAAISSNVDPDITEAIGFGPSATYFQGISPAPEIIDNYILSRAKNSANNNLDFVLIKSDDPGIIWESVATESATSTEEIATSTEEIATSTDELATSTEGITTSTEEIIIENEATSTEETATSSKAKLALINRIYSTGDNDWIELYNPSENDFDLASSGYRLEKTKTAEEPSLIMRIGDPLDGLYPSGTIIKSQDTYLIVRDEASDFYKSRADAIATRTDFSWNNSGYSIYLGTGPISSNIDLDVVDFLGYGEDATYWQGIGPAPAIMDNYILTRIATSSNNNLDFSLRPSDDPSINWSLNPEVESTSSEIYSFSAGAYDLFNLPEPINSPGLTQLWHFDECGGLTTKSAIGITTLAVLNHWAAGKYSCSKEAGYEYGSISGILDNPIDINNFSLSFWFQSTLSSPRLSLSLANSDGDSINITLEQGLMQFSGLPNPDWRYYGEFAFDDTWRLATLVVNRNEGYWSLYVDGLEKFHQHSYKILAPMDRIEIGGDNGPFAIDELAIWNRALSVDEIISFGQGGALFNPVNLPRPQAIPMLKHFWNFNEGVGTSSTDLIGAVDMIIDKNAWSNLDLVNSALVNNWDRNANAIFPTLTSSDLSLTFWWRSVNLENANRVRVSLRNETNSAIFTLTPSPYTSAYNFNGFYSYFSYGQNLTIPYDTNWHHLALVYDSYRNLLRFYVDGEEKGSRSFVWPANRPLADGIEVVSENGITEIDDLGIWEGALSPRQIQEIFANN